MSEHETDPSGKEVQRQRRRRLPLPEVLAPLLAGLAATGLIASADP